MDENKLAIVIATNEQLEKVGIDAISGRIVEVCEIDKYYSSGNCSKIITDSDDKYLKSKGVKNDFIINTNWLDFTETNIYIEQTIIGYKEKLATVKENHSATIDTNTDSENELYSTYTKLIAEFIQDLKKLKNSNK